MEVEIIDCLTGKRRTSADLLSDIIVADTTLPHPDESDSSIFPVGAKSLLSGPDEFGDYYYEREVFGTDSRLPVNFPEIEDGVPYKFFPYQTIGRILVEFANGKAGHGTGILIGKHHVLTAGHVINKKGSGEALLNKIEFRPMEQTGTLPIGSSSVSSVIVPSGWSTGYDADLDFAILILGYDFGDEVGWSSVVSAGDAYFQNVTANVTGYPGDKGGTTMYTASGSLKAVKKEYFEYEIDTDSGQSGAPIWITDSTGTNRIIAVHRGAVKVSGKLVHNRGTRITNDKMTLIKNALNL